MGTIFNKVGGTALASAILAIPNAAADGVTDDTAAVQAYLDERLAQGKPLILPAGVYAIKPSDPDGPILTVQGSAIFSQQLYGPGELKVAANSGNYEGMVKFEAPHNCPGATDCIFDHNARNNILPDLETYKARGRYTVYTYKSGAKYGSAKFNGNTIKNCDSHVSPYFSHYTGNGISQICYNTWLDGTNANGEDIDQSFINNTNDGLHCVGNRFYGASDALAPRTAIETHGSNQIVMGNHVERFQIYTNLSGIHQSIPQSKNILFSGNTGTVSRDGILIWGQTHADHPEGSTKVTIKGMTITDNRIHIAWTKYEWDESYGRFRSLALFGGDLQSDIEDLVCENNQFSYDAETEAKKFPNANSGAIGWYFGAAGAMTSKIQGMRISNNRVIGCPVSGFFGEFGAFGNLIIEGNEFIDCALTETSAPKVSNKIPMYLSILPTSRVSISRNKIIYNEDNISITDFIYVRDRYVPSATQPYELIDNEFIFPEGANLATVTDYVATPSSTNVKLFFKGEVPSDEIRLPLITGGIGSNVRYKDTGAKAEKVGVGAFSWRVTSYGGTAATPVTNGRRRGDLILVENPSANGHGAWIAISADTWKKTMLIEA